jgi:AAA domain
MNETNTAVLTEEPPKAITQPNPFTERANAEEAKPKKASLLSSITTRKRRRPFFGVLFGPPGVGKTTFGASLPKPLIVQLERGSDQLTVPRTELITTMADYKLWIQTLCNEDHDYQSIIIDSLDGLEVLVWNEICRIGKVTSVERFEGGYQKWIKEAQRIWSLITDRYREMSERWNILLVAHAGVKAFNDPSLNAAYDQWKIRLHPSAGDIITQSVDLLMFANIQRFLEKESPKAKKGRAIVSEERELYTEPTTGIQCKNRFNLQSPMPFTWEALEAGIEEFYKK